MNVLSIDSNYAGNRFYSRESTPHDHPSDVGASSSRLVPAALIEIPTGRDSLKARCEDTPPRLPALTRFVRRLALSLASTLCPACRAFASPLRPPAATAASAAVTTTTMPPALAAARALVAPAGTTVATLLLAARALAATERLAGVEGTDDAGDELAGGTRALVSLRLARGGHRREGVRVSGRREERVSSRGAGSERVVSCRAAGESGWTGTSGG